MMDIFGFDEREIAEGAVRSLVSACDQIKADLCKQVLDDELREEIRKVAGELAGIAL